MKKGICLTAGLLLLLGWQLGIAATAVPEASAGQTSNVQQLQIQIKTLQTTLQSQAAVLNGQITKLAAQIQQQQQALNTQIQNQLKQIQSTLQGQIQQLQGQINKINAERK